MSHALVIHRLKFSPSRGSQSVATKASIVVAVVVVAVVAGASSPSAHYC